MKKNSPLKIIIIFLCILSVLVLLSMLVAPGGNGIIQQARNEGILLSSDDIHALYQPIPAENKNAATELEVIYEDFIEWPEFFNRCAKDNTYQFQYTPGTEHLAKEGYLYDCYPEPSFNSSGISAEDMANLEYYVNSHQDQFGQLNEVISRRDYFYFDDWTDWSDRMYGLPGHGLLKAVAKLQRIQFKYYINDYQPDEAIKCIQRMYKLAEFASGSKEQIGQLVSSAITSLAQYAVVEMLARGGSSEVLASLEKSIPVVYVKDMVLNSLKIEESSLDENEFEDFSGSMEWIYKVKYFRRSNSLNHLELLLDIKAEVESRSIENYSTIYEDMKNKYLPGKTGFLKAIQYQKVHSSLVCNGKAVELLLRIENINRIIKIAIAQEKYYQTYGHFSPDLNYLKAEFPDLEIIDLLAQKTGDLFGYELAADSDPGQGYILFSDTFYFDPAKDTDPLENARNHQGSSWHAGRYRFVLKILR